MDLDKARSDNGNQSGERTFPISWRTEVLRGATSCKLSKAEEFKRAKKEDERGKGES